MSSLVKDDHPMFCMPCTILLMVSTNYPIFGCLHESTQSLFKDGICSITSWLIHEDVHQACLMLLIGPLHSARKTELSRWTHVGFASVMAPPALWLTIYGNFLSDFFSLHYPNDLLCSRWLCSNIQLKPKYPCARVCVRVCMCVRWESPPSTPTEYWCSVFWKKAIIREKVIKLHLFCHLLAQSPLLIKIK